MVRPHLCNCLLCNGFPHKLIPGESEFHLAGAEGVDRSFADSKCVVEPDVLLMVAYMRAGHNDLSLSCRRGAAVASTVKQDCCAVGCFDDPLEVWLERSVSAAPRVVDSALCRVERLWTGLMAVG